MEEGEVLQNKVNWDVIEMIWISCNRNLEVVDREMWYVG